MTLMQPVSTEAAGEVLS